MAGLIQVPFFDDETLLSYVSRVARANGRSDLAGFLTDFGFNLDQINRGEEKAIIGLAECLGKSPAELLPRRLVVNGDKTVSLGDSRFNRFSLWRTKLRFCPCCLEEDEANLGRMPGTRRYMRTLWTLPSVQTCPRHDKALIRLEDPRPNWIIVDTSVGLDLAAASLGQPSTWTARKSTAFDGFVEARLRGVKAHGSLLDPLPLSSAIDLCELFGMATVFGRKFAFRSTPDDLLLHAVAQGFAALEAGTPGIQRVLRGLASEQKSTNNRGGNALYGSLYRFLYHKDRGPEYDGVRAIVRDYTLSEFALLSGSKVFGDVEDGTWMSLTSIAAEAKLSTKTVRQYLIREGLLDLTTDSRMQFISRDQAQKVIDVLGDTAEIPELCSLLGWTKYELQRLVADGILVPSLNRAEKGKGLRTRFSRRAALELEGRLTAYEPPELGGLKPLRLARFYYKNSYSEVLRCLFRGELRKVAYIDGKSLQDRCLLDMNEVNSVLRRALAA